MAAGILGMHIDTVSATIDLGCPQSDQFHQVGLKSHVLQVLFQLAQYSNAVWRSFSIIEALFHALEN
jgi:hypothetical protein